MGSRKILFFILLAINFSVWADETKRHFEGNATTKRSIGEIDKSIKSWIATNFHLSESFVEDRFGTPEKGGPYPDDLNIALEQIDNNNDTGIANVLAQLMDTVNPKMAQDIFDNAKKELLALNNKDPLTSADKRKKKFLDRVLFAIWDWPTEKNDKQALGT